MTQDIINTEIVLEEWQIDLKRLDGKPHKCIPWKRWITTIFGQTGFLKILESSLEVSREPEKYKDLYYGLLGVTQ